MTSRAELLLAGPRGRRLCLGVVLDPVVPRWPQPSWTEGAAGHPVGRSDPAGARSALAAAVDAADLTLAGQPEPLQHALVASVDSARYWQPPDDVDQLLADPALAAVLAPVAEAVAAAPASAWWAQPIDRAGQHVVGWPWEGGITPPDTTGSRSGLVQWRTDTLIDGERFARRRPADPAAEPGGEWWSTPIMSRVPVTSRSRPGVAIDRPAPVGLLLVEDEGGWETARSWPVRVPGTARVHEISGPGAWVSLVERFPLDVSSSRRGVWWEVTGWDGAWAIPDWPAVAEEYDAVHLTVDGYLSTAGRALPVEVPGAGRPVHTLLGGWDPDATWWLTDVLPAPGEPTDWRREDDEPPRWSAG